jgi:integrase
MPTTDILRATDARAVFSQARADALAHAGVGLLLLAGLRPAEVEALRAADYIAGADGPRLRTGAFRHPRTIRIAPSAAAALEVYLAVSREAEALRSSSTPSRLGCPCSPREAPCAGTGAHLVHRSRTEPTLRGLYGYFATAFCLHM